MQFTACRKRKYSPDREAPPRRSPRNHPSSHQERFNYNSTHPAKRARHSIESIAPTVKRARLTRENLISFNEMGRVVKSSHSEASSKSISTTHARFDEQAQKNGILDEHSSLPPTNMTSLQTVLDQKRLTASPTESKFQSYVHSVARASNEEGVKMSTLRLLRGFEDDTEYCTTWNQSFSLFPHNAGFNDNLSSAQPDITQGLEAAQFPSKVIEQLGGSAKPYPSRYATTLSHFAGEWKGPGKDMRQAQGQAAYDGACLVYGRHKALKLLGGTDSPGHAAVHTFTSDGTTLNTFAHYALENPDGRVEYHQRATSRTILINSLEDFKAGYRRARNIQDHARANCEELHKRLVDHAAMGDDSSLHTTLTVPLSLTPTAHPEVAADTETEDELSNGQMIPSPLTPRSKTPSSQPKRKHHTIDNKKKKARIK